ncbi:MAG: MotA/TolQ/ExbB proton channel family protein [Deltaproteobacteria bacterium]|nr:MotA/TolQ/ExbB proton channel family protein [Deltaproteobacteria bacterium]
MFDTIARLFYQGGPFVMSGILFVLVISVVLIGERAVRYWFQYDLANSSGFMAAVQKMIMNNSIENAIRLCKNARPKLVPVVLTEGLMRANDSEEEIENAMEHATLSVLPKVTRGVPFLGTTANVATLLGLLGTIFGLIKAFGAAATATGVQKQTILAEGIAEALTATSFGLSTALLCLLAHGFLMMKQGTIINDINQNASRLIDLLITRKIKMKGSPVK